MSGAEILGIVAGGAGLLSLSIQLGESVSKLRRLSQSAKDVPKKMSRIIFALETISIALTELEHQRQQTGHSGVLLLRVIAQCQESTAEIQHLVDKIDSQLSRYSRLGKKLYALLKEPEVQGLLDSLGSATSSLELVYMVFLGEQQRRMQEVHSQYLASQSTQLQAIRNQLDTSLIKTSTTTHYSHSSVSGEVAVFKNTASTVEDVKILQTHTQKDKFPESRSKSKTKLRARIQLPTFISHIIWDFAVIRSQNSWSVNLQSCNVVPANSLIFRHCRNGDVDGMRRLFASGKASPMDVFLDRSTASTLLETAAEHSQLKVCQYLLSQTTQPNIEETLQRALSHLVRWRRWVLPFLLDDLFDSFLKHNDFSVVDLDDFNFDQSGKTDWLRLCSSKKQLESIIYNVFPGFDMFPLQLRFDLAFRMPFLSVPEFLRCVGLELSDSRLSSLRSQNGGSTLHLVARIMMRSEYVPLGAHHQQELLALGISILKNGADPWSLRRKADQNKRVESQNEHQISPLMDCICYYPHEQPYTWTHVTETRRPALRTWLEMIEQAGYDLKSYIARESRVWRAASVQKNGSWFSRHLQPCLKLEKTAKGLCIKLEYTQAIQLFSLGSTPGTFPASQFIPSLISWCPYEDERLEGIWKPMDERGLFRRELRFQACKIGSNSSMDEQRDAERAQDDSDPIMLMQYRASRRRYAKVRSTSQPPLIARRDRPHNRPQGYKGRDWLGSYHFCPIALQWRFDCPRDGGQYPGYIVPAQYNIFDMRLCARGCSQSTSMQESFTWMFCSFLGEIRACQDRDMGFWTEECNRPLTGHTFDPSCPQGCASVRLESLHVPQSLQEFHPKSKFGREKIGWWP